MIGSIIISQKLTKKVQQIVIFVEATGFAEKRIIKILIFLAHLKKSISIA